MMGNNETDLYFSGLLLSLSLESGDMVAILKDFRKFPSSETLLKNIARNGETLADTALIKT